MIASVSIVLSILAAASSASAGCNRNYTVKAGDICDGISNDQGVSTYQLASANTQLINNECSNLAEGMNLCLGWAGYDCTDVVTVKDNDSCSTITAAAGINSTLLTLNNPQIDANCSNLYTGEVLCVAKASNVNPYPSGSPVSVNWEATATIVANASSTSTASDAIATFYDASDAAAVGVDYDSLPFCDEA